MTAAQRNRDFLSPFRGSKPSAVAAYIDKPSMTALQKTLNALPRQMQNKAIRPALREAHKQVVKPRAQDHIHQNHHDIDEFANFLQIRSIPRQSGDRKGIIGYLLQFKAGTEAEFRVIDKHKKKWWKPSFFEYGSPSAKKGGGDRTGNGRSYGRIPGFSFMRRALYGHESEIEHVIGAEIAKRLGSAAAGAGASAGVVSTVGGSGPISAAAAAASGQEIHTGSRGGRFVFTSGGAKRYVAR